MAETARKSWGLMADVKGGGGDFSVYLVSGVSLNDALMRVLRCFEGEEAPGAVVRVQGYREGVVEFKQLGTGMWREASDGE